MKKGVFIVIDGSDGSGKGTQTRILIDNLKKKGFQVEMADFPQFGNKSAALVEEYLNGKFGSAKEVTPYQASIFYAVDRYAASFQIRTWLEEGKVVVSNRYTSANMGHQTGKIKDQEERERFLSWLDDLEFNIFNIPRPDMNFFLHVPAEIGQTLVDKKGHRDYVGGEKRDIHEADLNHLRDAIEAYVYVAKKYNWDVVECAPDNHLRGIENISIEILERVEKVLNED